MVAVGVIGNENDLRGEAVARWVSCWVSARSRLAHCATRPRSARRETSPRTVAGERSRRNPLASGLQGSTALPVASSVRLRRNAGSQFDPRPRKRSSASSSGECRIARDVAIRPAGREADALQGVRRVRDPRERIPDLRSTPLYIFFASFTWPRISPPAFFAVCTLT